MFEKSTQALDNLCEIKAHLDGSDVGFQAPIIDDTWFMEFKQLTLMHVPSSITDVVRGKYCDFIQTAMKGISTVLKLLIDLLVRRIGRA